MTKQTEVTQATFDVGHEAHQRRQIRAGLRMTPGQRLAWLEDKLAEMTRLLGKARTKSPHRPQLTGA